MMLIKPVALVALCPSGLVTVIVRNPPAALPATVRFNVMCEGSVKTMLFTVTPPPLTVALM